MCSSDLQTEFAAAVLDAMGHEQQQPVRRVAVSLAFDQLVVDLDERRPDPLFGDAQSPAQKRHERQKEFDGHAAHGLGEKHGSAEQDVQHQGQSGPGDGQDEQKNDAPKDPGRNRMNGRQRKSTKKLFQSALFLTFAFGKQDL